MHKALVFSRRPDSSTLSDSNAISVADRNGEIIGHLQTVAWPALETGSAPLVAPEDTFTQE